MFSWTGKRDCPATGKRKKAPEVGKQGGTAISETELSRFRGPEDNNYALADTRDRNQCRLRNVHPSFRAAGSLRKEQENGGQLSAHLLSRACERQSPRAAEVSTGERIAQHGEAGLAIRSCSEFKFCSCITRALEFKGALEPR